MLPGGPGDGRPLPRQTPADLQGLASEEAAGLLEAESRYPSVQVGAGSPSSELRASQTPPAGPVRMAARQKARVVCTILGLVLVTISCGSLVGVRPGVRAIELNSSLKTALNAEAFPHGLPVPMLPGPPGEEQVTRSRVVITIPKLTATVTTTTTELPPTMTPGGLEELTTEEATTATTSLARTSTSTRSTTTTAYYPTLFCFSVMRSHGEELRLVRSQLSRGWSIFGCEKWRVYSDKKIRLTRRPLVRIDSTLLRMSLEAPAGVKEHILNTEIFLQAWKQSREEGLTQETEWSAKVDPDAVFFPDRLRTRLMGEVKAPGASIYFINCKVSFGLFGALEVFSRVAMGSFFDGLDRCKSELPWTTYGEDLFMRRCMDVLGVQKATDYGLLSDGYCATTPFPCVSGAVAFHPFKSSETYRSCVHEARDAEKDGTEWYG